MHNRLKYSLPSIIMALLIFYMSHQSTIKLPEFGIDFFDKIIHMFGYFCFGLSLIIMTTVNFYNFKISRQVFIVFLIGIIYAMSDEIHQSFIPGRDGNLFDWIADVIGISLSLWLFYKTRLFRILKISK